MAWDRLFQIPLLSWTIRRLRAFPVRLESQNAAATREAVRLLEAEEALMIFPEGGRSPDGSWGPSGLAPPGSPSPSTHRSFR